MHSHYLTALSCLQGLDPHNCIRPFTPYVVMRVGDVPVVPYYRPGDDRIAQALAGLAPRYNAFYWPTTDRWLLAHRCAKPPTIPRNWKRPHG
ncbi:ribulose-5-phosphate 4-epimerase [Klebsiella pneumoniae]|uniref:Ribulose-5-phosphate 4-epimerase n=1 Tax=Klebsiella pneumoniae TaxID=573 RepID=A0A2X3CBG2_KLEPN|nr:ribulose-5-phosphate 4-epimerase [Klebsiella pneumoniae]